MKLILHFEIDRPHESDVRTSMALEEVDHELKVAFLDWMRDMGTGYNHAPIPQLFGGDVIAATLERVIERAARVALWPDDRHLD